MERREPIDLRIAGLGPAEVIGEGGNAFVYRSRQESLDRDVAVKVLKRASDEGTQRRFSREQRAMGRMSQHDGMVTVYESGINGAGEPYLVMPLLPGSLQDDIESQGRLPWAEAVDVISNVATTVHFAHQDGLVHRDLKPANLMRSTTGRPLVADFGISRILDAGVSMQSTVLTLTPAFSPPEALAGEDAGPTTDVYALGATLYALIEGHPPFVDAVTSTNLLALMRRISEDPVPAITVDAPDWINDVIAAAMAKDPTERISSADQLATLLRSSGTGRPAGNGTPMAQPSTSGAASTIISGGHTPDEGVDPSPHPAPALSVDASKQRRMWLRLGVAAGGIAIVLAAIFVVTSDGGGDSVPVADADTTVLRETTAASRTTVAQTAFQTIVLQAEDQILTPPMVARTDLAADGSAFVSTDEPDAGVVRFDFEVTQAGRYFIWARVLSAEPLKSHDSIAVRLNNEEVDVWDFFEEDIDGRVGWQWDLISTRCGGSFETHLCDPLRPNLDSARTHTLALSGREAASALDVIVVTNDPDYDPGVN